MPAVSDYSPLDRAYHEPITYNAAPLKLEDPIIPLNQLGQTVPESDPATGGNILQNVQAAIRRGAGNIQLVMTTSPDAAIGGRFKAYGKEVREELRAVLRANEVKVSGIELPTAISNLSGFDPQRGAFSEERRNRDVQEVRDAIRFAADVAGGGGVDVLSWEFDRNFSDAKWNKLPDGNLRFVPPEGSAEKETVQFVDNETGKVQGLRKSDKYFLPFNPDKIDATKDLTDQYADAKEGQHGIFEWDWKTMEKVAKKHNINPVNLLINLTQTQEIQKEDSYAKHYGAQSEQQFERVSEMMAQKEMATRALRSNNEEERAQAEQLLLAIEKRLPQMQEEAKSNDLLSRSFLQRAEKLREELEKKKFEPIDKYALGRATDAYADLGVAAMQETHNRQLSGNPIHVGPESGWPTYYGSHPTEFVELIRGARDKMAAQLKAAGHDEKTAREEAQRHIKGTFDTSHLGMFFQHFMPSEKDQDVRIKQFNKWFLEQVDFLAQENAKDQVLGNVQLVNSMSGAHGHLPPGQGIFPVIEAAKILKTKGKFDGFMISEGHEEEKFQQGRILLDTWRAFDPNILTGTYSSGGFNPRWTEVHQSYFGRPYSPTFIVGDYAPSPEFKLWSEVPLE